MMHQPDCPLFNQTIEGEGRERKKTLIRVIADQLPRRRKQFENQKNALKISDEKVISAINQHLTEAKKKPEKKRKRNQQNQKRKPRKRKRLKFKKKKIQMRRPVQRTQH
jgi:hypothetical protein